MPQAVALLSSALTLQAGQPVQLTPAGEFAAWDGRPGKGLTWKLSNADGRALCKRMNERHQRGPAFNFDYEHQTVLAEQNGQPAPAAGWSRSFEWRDDTGLFANPVEWTKRAAAHIESDEYRYISPALLYDTDTGCVFGVHNASLVNIPALDELPGVMARLSAQFSSSSTPEQSSMNLAQLLAALGLPATATEAEATSAIATLRQRADRADDLNTQLVTLKAAPPDAAKFVAIDRFNAVSTELATLKAAHATAEVDKLIGDAKTAGKVVSEAIEATWRDVGKSDLALLKKLVDGTPANPALAGQQQSGGKPPAGGSGADEPSGEALAICKAMGMDAATFAKGAA